MGGGRIKIRPARRSSSDSGVVGLDVVPGGAHYYRVVVHFRSRCLTERPQSIQSLRAALEQRATPPVARRAPSLCPSCCFAGWIVAASPEFGSRLLTSPSQFQRHLRATPRTLRGASFAAGLRKQCGLLDRLGTFLVHISRQLYRVLCGHLDILGWEYASEEPGKQNVAPMRLVANDRAAPPTRASIRD
jgi:hypothetical protein